jgi:plasmid stabilization system protein ParE
MPRVLAAPEALEDLERITDFLLSRDDDAFAEEVLTYLLEGAEVLKRFPLVGRKAALPSNNTKSSARALREWPVQRGKTGYLILYEHLREANVVRILRVRHQLEAGYPTLDNF